MELYHSYNMEGDVYIFMLGMGPDNTCISFISYSPFIMWVIDDYGMQVLDHLCYRQGLLLLF